MIGTHNSATGESGKGIISKLFTPFCRCQSKPLYMQHLSGCRFFDLRVRVNKTDKLYHFAHGLWTSQRILNSALYELDCLSATDPSDTWITVTYEGKLTQDKQLLFASEITQILSCYPNLRLAYIAVKKPHWTTILKDENCPPNYQGFYDLSKWYRAILPIPWLWNLLPQPKQQQGYRLVDFL